MEIRTKVLVVFSVLVLLVSVVVVALPVATAQPHANVGLDGGRLADDGKQPKERELPPELTAKLKEKIQPILSQIEEIKAGKNYVEGERIVVFKPEAPKAKIDETVGKVKAVHVKDVAKFGPKGKEKVVKLLRFESEEKAKQAEAELKKDPNVLYVARNFKVRAPPVSRVEFKGQPEFGPKAPTADPSRSYQWYLFKTKEQFAPLAPTAPTVAVIDTGVQYDHEELAGRVILGSDYVTGDGDPYDENGHGTAVAGIIGAKVNNAKGIAGISPKSMIYAIRVLDETGYGEFEWVMDGIVEACSNDYVKIINLSLGGYVSYPSDEYSAFEELINWCVNDMGKIVVSAAGNEDNIISYLFDDPDTDYYDVVPVPAAIPSSFTAAATDERDSRTFFSNYGTVRSNYVDIAAPGYRILSLDIYNTYTVWYGGTSFSAPIVAAAAARVWGKNAGWTNTQVMNQLVATGRTLGADKGFPVPVPRVDIAKALGITLTGIQGQIIDAENSDWFLNTLGGVKVTATTVKYAFSNNGGFYTITGLAPGTYTLTVTKGGYVKETRTVTVTAGQITEDVDFYMARVKPTTLRTVVVSWNSWNPGLLEMWNGFFEGLEHPDMPRFDAVAGREFDSYLWILPDDVKIGFDTLSGLDAELVVASIWVERPFETIVYKPISGKTYRFGAGLSPYLYNWGKIVGSGAITKVYSGTSIISTINSAAATGTADFWWHVYNQAGTGSPTVINKRIPMFGFVPVSGATILLVDDDGSGIWSERYDYSEWFKSALTDAGYTFSYWDTTIAGPPSPGDLAPYSIVIWFTGDDFETTLPPYERTAISSYLSAGKKLFITGQEIGYYLNENVMYSFFAPSFDAIDWYNTWLKAEYVFDAIDEETDDDGLYGVLALAGVNGDPISDPSGDSSPDNEMMLVIWDGDGADNQYFADGILPYGGSTAIFNYLDEEGGLFTLGGVPIAGGIRFPSPVPAPSTPYRLVYLSFGFEAISDAGTRAELIDEIIKFLNTGS
jgi:thermitase